MGENIKERAVFDLKEKIDGHPSRITLAQGMPIFLENPDEGEDLSNALKYRVPENITINGSLFHGEPNEEENYAVVTVTSIKRLKEDNKELERINKLTIDLGEGLEIGNFDKLYVKFDEIKPQLEKNKEKVNRNIGRTEDVKQKEIKTIRETNPKHFEKIGRNWKRYRPSYKN